MNYNWKVTVYRNGALTEFIIDSTLWDLASKLQAQRIYDYEIISITK